jgi:hypothetical protein
MANGDPLQEMMVNKCLEVSERAKEKASEGQNVVC